MAPGIYVSIDTPRAEIALRCGFLSTGDRVEAECDRLPELNRYKMYNEQLKKVIFEMDVAMEAIPTCL